jgi:MFS family permease
MRANTRYLERANVAAHTAEQIGSAAVPIIAVSMFGAGPREVGLLAVAQSLPFLIVSLPFGLLADRMSKRRLMIVGEIVRLMALTALAVCIWGSVNGLYLLGLLGFVGAVGTVAFSVSVPAMVPALVQREELSGINSRLELARSAAFALGPTISGALIASAGGSSPFVIGAIMSTAALFWMARLPALTSNVAHRTRAVRDLAAGFAFSLKQRWLRPILFTAFLWNASWFVLQAAYVPYAMSKLGLSSTEVGLTLGCWGVGMVIGALLAPPVLRRLPLGAAILAGPVLSVVAAALMLATLYVPSPALAAAAFLFWGVGPIVWTISTTTLRQVVSPADMLGRVGSIFLTAQMGARPLGAAIGAAVGTVTGTEGCLILAFAGFCAQAIVIWLSPVRTLVTLPSVDARA